MIDSNELMIGNYVMMENSDYYPQYSNSVFIVKGISDKTVLLQLSTDKEIEIAQKPKFLEPIPITEEWLVKLGFKNTIQGFYSTYELEYNFFVMQRTLSFDFSDTDRPIRISTGKNTHATCHFIHEIQNTIFWLTKQKLQIKE